MSLHNTASIDELEEESLSFYYQNCRGLNSKVKEFSISVISSDYDAIILSESWLSPSVLSSELFSNDFFVYRCNRSSSNSIKKHGRGVLIAIKSTFCSEQIHLIECDKLEIV